MKLERAVLGSALVCFLCVDVLASPLLSFYVGKDKSEQDENSEEATSIVSHSKSIDTSIGSEHELDDFNSGETKDEEYEIGRKNIVDEEKSQEDDVDEKLIREIFGTPRTISEEEVTENDSSSVSKNIDPSETAVITISGHPTVNVPFFHEIDMEGKIQQNNHHLLDAPIAVDISNYHHSNIDEYFDGTPFDGVFKDMKTNQPKTWFQMLKKAMKYVHYINRFRKLIPVIKEIFRQEAEEFNGGNNITGTTQAPLIFRVRRDILENYPSFSGQSGFDHDFFLKMLEECLLNEILEDK